MIIQRDFSRTKHDDFVIHVLPYIDRESGAIEILDSEGTVIGWRIIAMYE